jgi:hypothetical protein
MKHFCTACFAFVAIFCAANLRAAEPRAEVLFDGHDLKKWVVMHEGEWKIEEGVLVGRNGTNWSTNPEKSGSWLRTAKEYKDFVLELDYAINERGNSGIFIRAGTEKNPAFTGYEMQIAPDYGKPATIKSTGALYDVVAATKNMSKPAGEWNHARIEAHGQNIKVWLNGEQIIDYKADRRETGYIGLQNHDTRSVVKFRNIRVAPWSEKAP